MKSTLFLVKLVVFMGCLLSVSAEAEAQSVSVNGLQADYFPNASLASTPKLTRIDPNVNFDWGKGSPDPSVPVDKFSTRWTGQIQAPVSGNFTFFTVRDGGLRLWVNKQLLINDWADRSGKWNLSAPITLQKGQKYDVKVEFFHASNTSQVKLLWTYPGVNLPTVVSSGRLFATLTPPTLTGISPATVRVGEKQTTVTLNGSNFLGGAIAKFGTTAVSTTFVSNKAITAVVPSSLLSATGKYDVTVANNATNSALRTGAVTFAVTSDSNPLPTLTTLSPVQAVAGSSATTVTLTGTNFMNGTTVQFGSTALTPNVLSTTQLTVSVPANLMTSSKTYNVTVTNPAPGGGISNTATYTVTNKVPTLTNLLPASAIVGGAQTTVTLIGTNFLNGTKVNFGSTTLTPTVLSATQMTVAVPASMLTAATSYNVTATNPSPGGGASNASPFSVQTGTTTDAILSPGNLRVKGVWVGSSNKQADVLSWDSVPGAVSYNVYQYDLRIATGVKTTTYQVPTNVFFGGMTYTVTSVDVDGNESVPSSLSSEIGAMAPGTVYPDWACFPPVVPLNVVATPQWNGGKPRILLNWKGDQTAELYNIYRDGVKIAEGIWVLYYVDNNVLPGQTYSYTVTGNTPVWAKPAESLPSLAVRTTALKAAPGNGVIGTVKITKVVSNDDSVIIQFDPVAGAVDYRAYKTTAPNSPKYSAGSLSIEMNGIDPTKQTDIIVEAVDKFGPFQKMDGFFGPGAMDHDGAMRIATNGIADPSSIPNVLARSQPVTATFKPFALTGSQAFFDNFRSSQPFVSVPIDPVILSYNKVPSNRGASEVQNDKWIIRNYLGDMDMSQVFVMNNHLMETLYDGGTARAENPLHNNNSSMVIAPKATADISGGKVLHVTFEVDPHFNGRRWCDVLVAEAGDTLINPGKFAENNLMPTLKGNVFRWEVKDEGHNAQLYLGMDKTGKLVCSNLLDFHDWTNGLPPLRRMAWDLTNPTYNMNGTVGDLDKRHKFDLYLSQNRFRVYEQGILFKDMVMPAGTTLPFTKCAIYFLHQVYHTGNDRPDMITWAPQEYYWPNYRPWADERHWDNMGFEVLDSFPK